MCYFLDVLIPAFGGTIATLHVILMVIAYVYLFLNDSNKWFTKTKNN